MEYLIGVVNYLNVAFLFTVEVNALIIAAVLAVVVILLAYVVTAYFKLRDNVKITKIALDVLKCNKQNLDSVTVDNERIIDSVVDVNVAHVVKNIQKIIDDWYGDGFWSAAPDNLLNIFETCKFRGEVASKLLKQKQ